MKNVFYFALLAIASLGLYSCDKQQPADLDIAERIEDPRFRDNCLLRFDTDEDGRLSQQEVDEVDFLLICCAGCKSLKGIEYFTNLEILICNNNQLTSLDLSKCAKLSRLECQDNQLTHLDISGCPNLRLLQAHENQLTHLDVSHCPMLTKMHADENQLTALDVTKCPNLKLISCRDNQISELDVTHCPDLEMLAVDRNQLTNLTITYNPRLESLSCEGNQLTELDISRCALQMTDMTCFFNPLRFLYMRPEQELDNWRIPEGATIVYKN